MAMGQFVFLQLGAGRKAGTAVGTRKGAALANQASHRQGQGLHVRRMLSGHVSFQGRPLPERHIARFARKGLFAGVSSSVHLQVASGDERSAAILARMGPCRAQRVLPHRVMFQAPEV